MNKNTIVAILLFAFAAACIAPASAQTAPPPGVHRVISNFPYGTHERHRMDVYLPANPKGAPVIFMVHGGGWRRGDKTMPNTYLEKAKRWVPMGFIFIAINYRLPTDAVHINPLQQAEDVSKALSVAQARAATWGGDRKKFILMGHSAGAHLVSLVHSKPIDSWGVGLQPWLGTISLDSGALDVVEIMRNPDHPSLYDDAFGTNPLFWRSVSPFHQLRAATKPWLGVCSTLRADDPCGEAQEYADRAMSFVPSRAEVLPRAMKHGAINGELGLNTRYTAAVERFMRSLDPGVAALLPPIAVPIVAAR